MYIVHLFCCFSKSPLISCHHKSSRCLCRASCHLQTDLHNDLHQLNKAFPSRSTFLIVILLSTRRHSNKTLYRYHENHGLKTLLFNGNHSRINIILVHEYYPPSIRLFICHRLPSLLHLDYQIGFLQNLPLRRLHIVIYISLFPLKNTIEINLSRIPIWFSIYCLGPQIYLLRTSLHNEFHFHLIIHHGHSFGYLSNYPYI